MNRQIGIIIGVIAILGILGFVGFTQMNKSSAPSDQTASPQQSSESNKGTIQSLLSAGKNVMCDLSYPDGGGQGTVFTSGNKVRGDFTVKVGEQAMLTHMILDGENMYMWSDADNKGTKFKIDATQKASVPTNTQTADLNKEVDLKCSSWNPEIDKFTPPSNITFTDFSSVCDQITDPTAKASCLKALGN